MSLLDGKYEIISQTALGRGRTLVEATAPDGTLVRIEWFELEPAEEQTFERLRRVLKRLKRDGKAAVYDVISRPGAHYVAWEQGGDGGAQAHDVDIVTALSEHGFEPAAADIRRSGRHARLYGLAWDGDIPIPTAAPAEPAAEQERPPLRLRLPPALAPIGLTLLLLAASVPLLGFGFLRRANDHTVVVPDIVGQGVNDAERTLARLDLASNPTPLESTKAPGTVLAVQPAVGTELRPGRTVQLSYALPQGQLAATKVPQLVGETYPGQIATSLQKAGLELGTVAHIRASTPAGVVLAQSVPSGSKLAEGQSVDVLVSLGPSQQETFLPRLTGMSVDDARYLAGVAGLGPDQILVDKVNAPDGYPGEVLSQSPAAYVDVPINDAILRLVVQAGTPTSSSTSTVPSLIGMDLQQAEAAATGYTVTSTTVASPLLPRGVVLQTPQPGADPGDHKLALTVNVHPVTLTPPGAVAIIKQPTLRHVPYVWIIEPGIPQQVATVYAQPLDGQRTLVGRTTVRGGDTLRGTWLTTYPGPVTFTLQLNGQPYGAPLFVP